MDETSWIRFALKLLLKTRMCADLTSSFEAELSDMPKYFSRSGFVSRTGALPTGFWSFALRRGRIAKSRCTVAGLCGGRCKDPNKVELPCLTIAVSAQSSIGMVVFRMPSCCARRIFRR